ncbi:MAG: molybdopterin molybdotransferase MoeA [Verrucomicrobiota bacterium]|nr:molybdopterin molybdotransferase MoeA [Verrucomicrobiota bacterium]
MITEAEARTKILARVRSLPPRIVPIDRTLGCFAAHDMTARLPLPLFDNSAMDGYAVIAESCRRGERLRVVGEQAAGVDRKLRVGNGEAVRVFTGAAMPEGADAVVMQEDVTRDGAEIVVNTEVETGEFVRQRGCDLSEGQKILEAGDRLRPQTQALLAAQGFSDIEVGGEVRAAVVSTGDELVRSGDALQPGQIYESNSTLLRGLLEECGVSVESSRHAADRPEDLKAALRAGIKHDALIVSGGVSVGDRDLVRPVLADLGAEIDVWRVSIKPGKPFLFGRAADCAIFGLPGNPVSAFVTFLLLVRPALLKLMGANDKALHLPVALARLAVDVQNDGDRPHYIRGELRDGEFTPIGRQESHALFGMSRSNALLCIAPGKKFSAGALVQVQFWA